MNTEARVIKAFNVEERDRQTKKIHRPIKKETKISDKKREIKRGEKTK